MHAEIVVVGGGVIGASIAYHLTARGATDVLLVERDTICSGETQKSGGFVQTHWDDIREVRLIAWSRELFRNWGERIGGDCGWVEGGYLHVTGDEREPDVRRVHQMLLDDGLDSHWLDPGELAKLVPILNIHGLVGGAWEPTSGWANPLATTRSLVDAARRAGARIEEGITVSKIVHASGKITGVETTRGAIACRVVILAAGPGTPALHAGAPLPITLERGQVCYLSRPNGLPDKAIGFYDEVTGVYTHPDGDVNLVGRDRDYPFAAVSDPEDYKRDVDAKYVAKAALALGRRFPALRESILSRGVVGLYDFTPDGQPIVDGPLGIAGYYVAAGFSGVGFKSALATGLGMAEIVLAGRATSVDLDHLRLERFR